MGSRRADAGGAGGARGKRGSRGSGKAPLDNRLRMRAGGCLDETFLVEAGAGTGKTALLMERLRNIICDREVPMEGLVAITFTEKAAGELKSRLREELEKWEAVAEGERRDRVRAALDDIDKAVVSTIHSFCSSMLHERPVEAGVEPGFAVAESVEANELFEKAWEQWLEVEMVPGNHNLAPAFMLGATLENVKSLASALMSHREALAWLPEPVPLPEHETFLPWIRQETAALNEMMDRYLESRDDRLLPEIEKVERFVERSSALGGADWHAVYPELAALSGKVGRKGAARNWSSKGALDEAREKLSEVYAEAEEVAAALRHNAVVMLAGELARLAGIYERLKSERGVLDFDDLLLKARDLLRDNREARDYFKRKYKYILIDEFQDTDPLQAESAFFLAEKLDAHCSDWESAELQSGKLFLVGDPKQSIYRFRGADIEVYERAKKVLGRSGGVLEISVNFRSTPGIIDPVNLAFEKEMRPPEEGLYQPSYVPLKSFREDAGPGVVLLGSERELGEDARADQRRRYEAAAMAWCVKQAVEKSLWTVAQSDGAGRRPAGYGDMALLFWASTGLGIYEEALRSWGIPYRVAGGKAFYSRAEIRALVSVLSAVERPHDGIAMVAALRSPFFGISDEEVFLHWAETASLNYMETEGAGNVGKAFATLRKLRGRRNTGPLSSFLDGLYRESGALPVFYMRPQGEQRVANLLKISSMAAKLEESGPLTFKRFVRWVAEQEESGVEEGESPIREAGDDFVTVLTIHKAKGLEFPVVFLPGLWSRGRGGEEMLVIDRGSRKLDLKVSKNLGLMTRGWDEASRRESDIARAEKIRLLYVAMTRARDRIVLPCLFGAEAAAESAKGRGPGGPIVHLEEVLRLAAEGEVEWCERMNVPPSGLEVRRERASRIPDGDTGGGGPEYASLQARWESSMAEVLGEAAVASPRTSPTALLSEEVLSDAGEMLRDEAVEETTRGETGRKIGKLVHAAIEASDDLEPGLMRDLSLSLGMELGLDESSIDLARSMLEDFCRSDFAGRIRRALCVRKEVPFCVNVAHLGEPAGKRAPLVEGTADLLMLEDDGWRVVDFKTDAIQEAGVRERANHYRPQGACYALCLSKVLRRPVVEVIFYFLRPQRSCAFPVDRPFIREAALAVRDKLTPPSV